MSDTFAAALLGVLQAIDATVVDTSKLIACPTCRARLDQPCRTATGSRRAEHASRLVSQRCACGGVLTAPWSKVCPSCRVQRRRANNRESARRWRARRRLVA